MPVYKKAENCRQYFSTPFNQKVDPFCPPPPPVLLQASNQPAKTNEQTEG